jgi:hypothetical protein
MARCRNCRHKGAVQVGEKKVRRSPDGRRVNHRKEQRAAKMKRLMKEANHLAVESSSC